MEVTGILSNQLTAEYEHIAQILLLRANTNELLTLLARGRYSEVINAETQGRIASLEKQATLLEDVYSLPRFKGALARAYAGVRQGDKAKAAIQNAVNIVVQHAPQKYVDKAFFLDFSGARGYERYVDFHYSRQVDILIELGEVKQAYDVYREITRQGKPSVHISLRNWFDPDWQKHLSSVREQFHPLDEDPKLSLQFSAWVDEFRHGGEAVALAFLFRSYARLQRSLGNDETALRNYKDAMRTAKECGNISLSIEAGISCCNIHIERKEKQLALDALNLIQKNLEISQEKYFLPDYYRMLEALACL